MACGAAMRRAFTHAKLAQMRQSGLRMRLDPADSARVFFESKWTQALACVMRMTG